ncbi:uncharacterized protein BDV17DRAFT_235167 [Aspergillus undulatus]|uniref:uncharacterized protein n=1 Tax=Aspergillus undulatus TaxID=1810928 RepID=UPI003CCDF404
MAILPPTHWAAFLQYYQDESVRLDMTPGYGPDGLRGRSRSRPRHTPSRATPSKSWPSHSEATVRTIIDLVNSNGCDRYRFSEWEGVPVLDIHLHRRFGGQWSRIVSSGCCSTGATLLASSRGRSSRECYIRVTRRYTWTVGTGTFEVVRRFLHKINAMEVKGSSV